MANSCRIRNASPLHRRQRSHWTRAMGMDDARHWTRSVCVTVPSPLLLPDAFRSAVSITYRLSIIVEREQMDETVPHSIVAEFHKDSGGRFELFSLTVIEDRGEYLSGSIYDVDHSRKYGYLFH